MDAGQRVGNVQRFAGRTPLRLHADGPYPDQQGRQSVGYFHQFVVEPVILNALKYLVKPVQAALEAVVGPAPQAPAEFHIILPPLPGGAEKAQPRP